MKLTHSQKLKKAKRMMELREIIDGVSPFNSKAWKKRRAAMVLKVKNRNSKIKEL